MNNNSFFQRSIYYITIYTALLAVCSGLFLYPAYARKRIHSVFFEDTDYELHVYKSFGETKGKTLMLLGGIQGDEPGGFLSADHYADIRLEKGNLIVVPRANFHSIVLNRRQINEDMNRRFADNDKLGYEDKIVGILKKLIKESDCLLNLHDGSGFYAETWIGPNRNPMKYGQSIIADCATVVNPKTGEKHNLEDIARSVALKINKKINNPLHYFHFNNHKTSESGSKHKEQRKSATYFAWKKIGILAFGVETSKTLTLEKKVLYHNIAINLFMETLGIVPETPGLKLDAPMLEYLVTSINGSLPIVIRNNQTLFLNKNDTILISHIEANYVRGLTADVLGYGTINDLNKKIKIGKPTIITTRKDYYPCGKINLSFNANGQILAHKNVAVSDSSTLYPVSHFFKLKINNKEQIYKNNDYVNLIKGDKLEIIDIITNLRDSSSIRVNFRGFVANMTTNTGEDRGFVISTDKDLWTRYSLHKKGKTYQIEATHKNSVIGKLTVHLSEPKLNYIIITKNNGTKECITKEGKITLNPKNPIKLFEINTNVGNNNGVKTYIKGADSFLQPINVNKAFTLKSLQNKNQAAAAPSYNLQVKRYNILLGLIPIIFISGDKL